MNWQGGAIERLKQMPRPVVRVSGPITASERFSYEENIARFIKAQQVLRKRGLSVFDYVEDPHDEEVIKSLNASSDDVMQYYHDPILHSGLFSAVYMMPHWELSGGARQEHQHFLDNGLPIEHIPEEWLR